MSGHEEILGQRLAEMPEEKRYVVDALMRDRNDVISQPTTVALATLEMRLNGISKALGAEIIELSLFIDAAKQTMVNLAENSEALKDGFEAATARIAEVSSSSEKTGVAVEALQETVKADQKAYRGEMNVVVDRVRELEQAFAALRQETADKLEEMATTARVERQSHREEMNKLIRRIEFLEGQSQGVLLRLDAMTDPRVDVAQTAVRGEVP